LKDLGGIEDPGEFMYIGFGFGEMKKGKLEGARELGGLEGEEEICVDVDGDGVDGVEGMRNDNSGLDWIWFVWLYGLKYLNGFEVYGCEKGV
jgi:hypothetical protein